MKLTREDTPTRSIWQRYKYEILVKHLKLTLRILLGIIVFFIIGFVYVIFVYGVENWPLGFVGMFILLFDIIKWTVIGFWFVFSRGGWAILFAPIIYFLIKQFIHNEKVALCELGSPQRYFFKITTTSDGYLLHQDKLAGLLKKPVYLDKTTVQYFKENGTEKIDKESGKKDKPYLAVDIVPLFWRGDSLLITDEQTGKQFVNNAILVTESIRDYYALVVKGFSPADREAEKGIIYDKILGFTDLKSEILQLKRKNKEMDIQHIEKVAEYLIPSPGDEALRFKGLLEEGTQSFDPLAKNIVQRAAMAELLMKGRRDEKLTDKEIIRLVAADEID